MTTKDDGVLRGFDTGATRDTSEGKLLYDKFLCPAVLKQYAKFMNMNRLQSDGKLRDGDNWQKGIPMDVYLGSEARHHHEFWAESRETYPQRTELIGAACGMLFNIMGYIHEWLKTHDMVDFDGDEPTGEMRARQEKVARELSKAETAPAEIPSMGDILRRDREQLMTLGSISENNDPCGPDCGCGKENGFPDDDLLDQEEIESHMGNMTCAGCKYDFLGLYDPPCNICENFELHDKA